VKNYLREDAMRQSVLGTISVCIPAAMLLLSGCAAQEYPKPDAGPAEYKAFLKKHPHSRYAPMAEERLEEFEQEEDQAKYEEARAKDSIEAYEKYLSRGPLHFNKKTLKAYIALEETRKTSICASDYAEEREKAFINRLRELRFRNASSKFTVKSFQEFLENGNKVNIHYHGIENDFLILNRNEDSFSTQAHCLIKIINRMEVDLPLSLAELLESKSIDKEARKIAQNEIMRRINLIRSVKRFSLSMKLYNFREEPSSIYNAIREVFAPEYEIVKPFDGSDGSIDISAEYKDEGANYRDYYGRPAGYIVVGYSIRGTILVSIPGALTNKYELRTGRSPPEWMLPVPAGETGKTPAGETRKDVKPNNPSDVVRDIKYRFTCIKEGLVKQTRDILIPPREVEGRKGKT
jgi:hypothetical protein